MTCAGVAPGYADGFRRLCAAPAKRARATVRDALRRRAIWCHDRFTMLRIPSWLISTIKITKKPFSVGKPQLQPQPLNSAAPDGSAQAEQAHFVANLAKADAESLGGFGEIIVGREQGGLD